MYLSRIALNTKLRKTMWALASPQVLHSAVESSFPRNRNKEENRVLWRIDNLADVCYLLVLSTEQPDFLHIAQQFGYPHMEPKWETKNYNILLDRLKNGQVWRFRLRANPVRSSFTEKDGKTGRGKVFAHLTQEQQRQWLLSRAQAHGFSLSEDDFDVVHTEWKKFRKQNNKHEVSLRTADFEGILTISDVELFKRSLLSGIGRAKAYGCGLLTIARCRGDHGE